MKPVFFLNVDILGTCNLACPSCPQGNAQRGVLPRGLMSLELFEAILDKAMRECAVSGVGLFNWTEPLLHPHCALFVTACRLRGLPCHLSSNLNDIRNLPDVLRAGPTSLRISVSGYTNPTYQRTHARGDIEKVKANMLSLADMLLMLDVDMRVTVLWHRYKHNVSEEAFMRTFVENLGFQFETCEAYLMPLETVLNRWRWMPVPEPIEDLLLTPLVVAEEKCAPHRALPCRLQQRELTIDAAGDAHLCCALYDPRRSRIGPFLKLSLAEIQSHKAGSLQCDTCLKAGGHVYATFGWKRKERWLQKLGNLRAKLRGLRV